ncbi:hypothetical protein [Clostridium sp.]
MLFNFSTLSYTNKNFNEDILGYTSKAAWVLDGATGYFNNRIPNYNSEAEWYVSEWNKYFYSNIDNMEKSLKQILLEGMKEIKQKYYSIVNCENIEEATLPTATIAIIRIESNYINYYVLGDCIVAIKENESEDIKIITDNRIGKLENRVIESIVKIQKEKNVGIKYARNQVIGLLKENRKLKNTDSGYWILGFDEKAINFGIQMKIKINKSTEIMLMTDGFYRIIDTFSHYKNTSQLIEDVKQKGLNYIYNIIDEYENKDSECIKYPRTKKSDDSTAIYLKLK